MATDAPSTDARSPRIAYVNGDFVTESEARISIFDRGFLFGDAVYEVTPVVDGHLTDRAAHMQRLRRSLEQLSLAPPLPLAAIDRLQQELVQRNSLVEGRLYLQISRGPAERDFAYPEHPQPSLVMFCRSAAVLDTPGARRGLRVCTLPDTRWARRDIKTVMLLAQSMAKQQARERGCDDAWFVEDGRVTEGTSNNAYIVSGGAIHTRALSNEILAGCTRRALLTLAGETGIDIVERAFTPEQAYRADEAFVTSASTFVTAVVEIDGHPIGDGRPGPLSRRLREIYIAYARSEQGRRPAAL